MSSGGEGKRKEGRRRENKCVFRGGGSRERVENKWKSGKYGRKGRLVENFSDILLVS